MIALYVKTAWFWLFTTSKEAVQFIIDGVYWLKNWSHWSLKWFTAHLQFNLGYIAYISIAYFVFLCTFALYWCIWPTHDKGSCCPTHFDHGSRKKKFGHCVVGLFFFSFLTPKTWPHGSHLLDRWDLQTANSWLKKPSSNPPNCQNMFLLYIQLERRSERERGCWVTGFTRALGFLQGL